MANKVLESVTIQEQNPDVVKVEGGRLIVNVAINEQGALSGSGKSRILYSTHGNIVLNDGSVLGLNHYRKVK